MGLVRKLKILALAIVLATGLAGCLGGGGGGSSSNTNAGDSDSNPTTPPLVVLPEPISQTGVVVDWLLKGALVFADLNGDSELNAGEVFAFTDDQGQYTLTNLPSGSNYNLVVRGGIDIATNDPFKAVLKSPAGYTNISPVTTLVYELKQQGLDNAKAEEVTRTLLGINPNTLLDIDATTDKETYAATQQLMTLVSGISQSMSKVVNKEGDETFMKSTSQVIFTQLANSLKESAETSTSNIKDAINNSETLINQVIEKTSDEVFTADAAANVATEIKAAATTRIQTTALQVSQAVISSTTLTTDTGRTAQQLVTQASSAITQTVNITADQKPTTVNNTFDLEESLIPPQIPTL